jgi:hypothetical protein
LSLELGRAVIQTDSIHRYYHTTWRELFGECGAPQKNVILYLPV